MTQEEKAKAYDEAIEKIKYVMEHGVSPVLNKEDLQDIFPEIFESEDERIEKEIIAFLKENLETGRAEETWSLSGLKRWIAWLEKQGEQETDEWKEGNIIRHGGILALVIRGRRVMKSNGEIFTVQYPDEWVKAAPKEIEHFLNEFEKQGEQPQGKTALEAAKEEKVDNANKVEPKFKVGDWIANSIETVQITGYDIDYGYQVNYKGKLLHRDADIIEKEYHLWTIQDAKDGDVLWHSDSASNGIFIFKEIRHDGKVLCYCDYDSEDHFCTGEYHTCCWSCDKYIKPANKEQRDFLFARMKDAGYEWDAEEKELRKIE